MNAVTGKTYACFEPALDYLVVKFPKWPFDKFVYANRTLGTQMMATGEVMAIGTSFEQAMMKAVRSIELKLDTLDMPKMKEMTTEELYDVIRMQNDERIFAVYEACLLYTSPTSRIFLVRLLVSTSAIPTTFCAFKYSFTSPSQRKLEGISHHSLTI